MVHLKSNKSDFPITKDEIVWIAPLLPIGYNIGHIAIPFIINRFDQKWILLIFSLPQISSWLLIILAKNPINLYIARILGGIGYGGGICALVVYLSEISTQKTIGIFLSFIKVFQSLGIFYIMLLGAYSSYYYMNIIILVTMIVFIFTFLFMPDATFFFDKNNQVKEEIKMLKHSKLEDAKQDFEKREDSDKKINFIFKIKETTFWKLIAIQANRKALLIVTLCAAQDVFSGHVILRYFSHEIFAYNSSFLAPEKASLLLASIKVMAALMCTQVIERVRRKILLLITGFLGAVGMGLVGLFFFLKNSNVDISSITWLPIFGIAFYDVMLTFGFANFVYIYPGELFPSELKGVGIMSCKVMYYIFAFLNIWQYEILVDLVNTHVIFWTFAISGLFICLITLQITPETKGKSIEEIQISLKSQKFF